MQKLMKFSATNLSVASLMKVYYYFYNVSINCNLCSVSRTAILFYRGINEKNCVLYTKRKNYLKEIFIFGAY